jgi:hypothetical protein
MVGDASSGDGQSAGANRNSSVGGEAPDPQRAAELTQELAQLRAATIAQRQGSKGHPAGVPTGAELTSLANLMSMPRDQRTLAPAFKDGLSALSYQPPVTGPELEDHDDEPMPIPSTWREPAPNTDDKWFRQQMGAAALGLVAGLFIVVPAVLWLSGHLGGPQKNKVSTAATRTTAAASDAATPEVKTVKVQVRPIERAETAAAYVTGSVEPRRPVELVKPPEPAVAPASHKAAEPATSQGDELLNQAKRRLDNGDVTGARELLATIDTSAQGPASFVLAETYDPNMLAAWGTRGVSADVVRARALYQKALTLGVTRAQARIDALK